METGSDFQEGADTAAGTDTAHGRARHFGQKFQERALPRPIFADDADHIALLNLEVYVPESPDILTAAGFCPVIGFADLQIRVLFLEDGCLPPPVEVMGQRLGGYQT